MRAHIERYLIPSLTNIVIAHIDICKELGAVELERRVLSWFNNNREVLPYVAIPWVRLPLVPPDDGYCDRNGCASWNLTGDMCAKFILIGQQLVQPYLLSVVQNDTQLNTIIFRVPFLHLGRLKSKIVGNLVEP